MHNPREYHTAFQSWLTRPLGQYILSLETELVSNLLQTMNGYNLLLIGDDPFAAALDDCKIKHKFIVNNSPAAKKPYPHLIARQDKTPILSEGVDVVYLAHCLELVNNPHEVLREVYRVLMPEGQLIVSLFNPFSLWGCYRIFARYFARAPWGANFMSMLKIKDWLALLGFDIIRVSSYGYCLPVNYKKVAGDRPSWEKFGQKVGFPCGAAYVVVARKRVMTMTPIKPTWQPVEEELAANIVETPPGKTYKL